MKYYFITYLWKGKWNWKPAECCINIHPIRWLINMRETKSENYNLIGWQELTKNEYKIFKDKVRII